MKEISLLERNTKEKILEAGAEILNDDETKKAVWHEHLKDIFSRPDDPNYCVCKITPYRIEYQGMGMVPPQVWES